MTKMIEQDSWIRRYPTTLDSEQSYFLDGVRFAVQTAQLSFDRLGRTLDWLAFKREEGEDTEPRIISAVQDTWFIIDAVDRLRSLVKKPPKSFGAEVPDEIAAFLESTDDVRSLRNYVQHLAGRVEGLAGTADPTWGHISWVSWRGTGEDAQGYLGSLIGGTVRSAKPGVVHSRGIIPSRRNERAIVLEADAVRVRLDALMSNVAELVGWLESLLHRTFASYEGRLPLTMPDLLTVLTLNMSEFSELIEQRSDESGSSA